MSHTPTSSQRLLIDDIKQDGSAVQVSRDQAHYLGRVLRLKVGDSLRIFNGRDGEFLAEIETITKSTASLRLIEKLRAAEPLPDIDYLFAPLKSARLDYMAQKACEMGAGRLQPVFTDYTQMRKVNLNRLKANCVEAAEQCNMVALPEVLPAHKLSAVLDDWPETKPLIFCDEAAPSGSPIKTLLSINASSFGLLVGPEGGFSPRECERLRAKPGVVPISLGPRIMRADTAAVAALALLQATKGDWQR